MFGFGKKDRDELVIKALKDSGSDLSKPHHIDFNFDFSTFEQAAPVAQALDKDGFEIKMFENDDHTFTIEAKKTLIPSIKTMRALTKQFKVLTEKYGGNYDGWGTEIVD